MTNELYQINNILLRKNIAKPISDKRLVFRKNTKNSYNSIIKNKQLN